MPVLTPYMILWATIFFSSIARHVLIRSIAAGASPTCSP